MISFREFLLSEVEDSALISRFGRRQHVDVKLDKDEEKEWYLAWLGRKKSETGFDPRDIQANMAPESKKGSGAKVMRALSKIADKRKATVSLSPAGNHPKLRKFYSQFGYDPHPQYPRSMVRKPR